MTRTSLQIILTGALFMLLSSAYSSYYLMQRSIIGLTLAIHDGHIVIDEDHRANVATNCANIHPPPL